MTGEEKMHIRDYHDGDLAALVQLWQECDLLTNPLNDPARDIALCRDSGHGTILIGIDDDDEVVGSVMVGHDGHRGWIYYLASKPDRQGKGYGRLLMTAGENWLWERQIPKVELLVRDTNTRVIGFYQRLGYNVEPREIMSKRLDGVALDLAQQKDDAPVVITYLAMDAKPSLPQIEPKYKNYVLLRANQPTVSYYRYLYDAVGREWFWTDRKRYNDQELKEILEHPANDLFVVLVEGNPAGFFELNRRDMPTIDLAYFGILPEFIGGRLGPWLLAQALEEIWRHEPARATVNTCTLDHPSALPMYQRLGFQPYDREEVAAPWQRQVPALDEF